MSGAIQTEFPVLHIRWTVDTRKEQDSSSEFTFQGRQWRLYYYYRGEQRLALERMSEEDHPPFDVSVHIEGGATDRTVVRGLSWRGRFEAGTRFKIVWSKPESEVVRVCPEFGRNNNHQLRFLVELKRRDVVRGKVEQLVLIFISISTMVSTFRKIRGSQGKLQFLENKTEKSVKSYH